MSGPAMTQGYVLACLNTTTAILEGMKERELNLGTTGGDRSTPVVAKVIPDLPKPPIPKPSGTGCEGRPELMKMLEFSSVTDALTGLLWLVATVKEAIESSPLDESLGASS